MPEILQNKRQRVSPDIFKNFDFYFRQYFSIDKSLLINQIDACKKYNQLNKKEKNNLYKWMQQQMNVQAQKLQKHYANSYRKCLFPDKLDKLAKSFIIHFVWQAHKSNMMMQKGLHTNIKAQLIEQGYNIFSGDIDAYITELKTRIRKGLINCQHIKSISELKKMHETQLSAKDLEPFSNIDQDEEQSEYYYSIRKDNYEMLTFDFH